MRNVIYLFMFFQFCLIYSQVPDRLSYQGVVRDNSGNLVSNSNIGVKISLLKTVRMNRGLF